MCAGDSDLVRRASEHFDHSHLRRIRMGGAAHDLQHGRDRSVHAVIMLAVEAIGVARATVVIPTIGRPEHLRPTLRALAACTPRADEVLVVDQSHRTDVADLVADFAECGARLVHSNGEGVALAVNEGLREARNEVVLLTDDDCSAGESWIKVACELTASRPGCVFTGRVLPLGDPGTVPATRTDDVAHDYTGQVRWDVLLRGNMVVERSAVIAFGAFDERFVTSAEDDDFCYRWLKAGGCLRYEPSLVVWHRHWRGTQALDDRYVQYWREQGWFYAKHLRTGDLRFARDIARDIKNGMRAAAGRTVRRRGPSSDPRRGIVRGLFPGLVGGWRASSGPRP